VGKSSLYNRLVGRDAAIVTDIEGTTRDVLSETVSMGRVMLRLFDTAGLHETDNPVEQIGIARTRDAMSGAELVFAMFDGSAPADEEDRTFAMELLQSGSTVVAILNKSDRADGTVDPFYAETFDHTVSISAQTGEGMDALYALVERLFTDDRINLREDAVLTNARQQAAAYRASQALMRALDALRGGFPIELSCVDAEDAMTAIAELDGRAVSEDIVAQIFARFCVGK
jgi:tRNA modification GTPase